MRTENYGVELQSAIKRAGLTPSKIAADLGVSNQTVNNWFKRGAPTRYVAKLASLLNVAAVDLADVVVDNDAFIECYRLPIKDEYGNTLRRIQADRNAIPFSAERAETSFFLIAPDDSMAPDIIKGDNVLITDVPPQPGETVAVKAPDGRLFLRQWGEVIPGQRFILRPINTVFAPIEIQADEDAFTIMGIVSGMIRYPLKRTI